MFLPRLLIVYGAESPDVLRQLANEAEELEPERAAELPGSIHPTEPGCVGTGGLTCSCPTSPHSRHRTRRGRRSDPFPWLTHSPSGTRATHRSAGSRPRAGGWAAAGFTDTLLRWIMKPEVGHGNEAAVQPGVQA